MRIWFGLILKIMVRTKSYILPELCYFDKINRLIREIIILFEVYPQMFQLPQLSYGFTLPTTDMSQRTRPGNDNLDAMIHRPVPYLSPVNNMSEASAKFARSKRIGISLCASVGAENPFEESLLRLRPRRGMISARPSSNPLISDALRPCGKIRCFKSIKTCLAYLKRLHRLLSGDRPRDQLNDRVAHMGDTQPVSYLMFHGAYDTPKFRFCSPQLSAFAFTATGTI